MAKKVAGQLPPFLDLGGNWIIEWDAVDPTTGATVPGVVISNTSLQVAGDLGPDGQGPKDTPDAPLLAHEPGTA